MFSQVVFQNRSELDAKRVQYDLGGLLAIVTVDGSFQQVTHLHTRTTDIRPQDRRIPRVESKKRDCALPPTAKSPAGLARALFEP